MKPLELKISNHQPSSFVFGQMSTLRRISTYNQDYLDGWLKYNHRFYKNESVIVQVLMNLGISKDWSLEYLTEWTRLRKEQISSVLKICCVRNPGKTTHNTIYQPEFTEQYILIPEQKTVIEYMNDDESLICPIIPLLSNEILLDYQGPVFSGPVSKKNPDKIALIGIDILGLAIYYWRFLNTNPESNVGPHHWLASVPLVNARILAHRVGMLDVLYNNILSKTSVLSDIEVITPCPLNDISGKIRDYLESVLENINKFGVYDETDLLNIFKSWDTLPVDPLRVSAGIYNSYAQTQCLWQLPVIKIFTMINLINKASSRKSDSVKTRVEQWFKQDVKGMIRNYCPSDLVPMYEWYVDNLRESVK